MEGYMWAGGRRCQLSVQGARVNGSWNASAVMKVKGVIWKRKNNASAELKVKGVIWKRMRETMRGKEFFNKQML